MTGALIFCEAENSCWINKPSFPRRRESSRKNIPRSGHNLGVDLLRRILLSDWIPACAGMTGLRVNDGAARE
jgi:hypothetical protein